EKHPAPIFEYWPQLKEIFACKTNVKNAIFAITDATQLHSDSDEKFKPFFVQNTLARTPEASKYLALKAKSNEINKQAKALAEEIVTLEAVLHNERKNVSKAIQQIKELEQSIKEKQDLLIVKANSLSYKIPQAERTKNALTTMES
ncbi:MAG: hypothetical protein ACKO96_44525, partial [Flammeovirgaceae bacterium]